MTSIVNLHSGQLKTAGVSANVITLLQDRNISFSLFYELPGRTNARRACS
jgi:hypothetical protein